MNTDTLRHLLDQVLPEKNKDGQEDYAGLLTDLKIFNITTVRGLKDIITRNWDNVSKEEKRLLSLYKDVEDQQRKKGVFFTHVGLVRESLGSEFGTDFNKYMHEKYSSNYIDDESYS